MTNCVCLIFSIKIWILQHNKNNIIYTTYKRIKNLLFQLYPLINIPILMLYYFFNKSYIVSVIKKINKTPTTYSNFINIISNS